jgi:murein DD-endopeptidase MepM/ murein hydrolase activator NlpD
MQKLWLLGSILLTVGCSQRAPWRVMPAPAVAPVVTRTPVSAAGDAPRQQAIALSIPAAAPLDATAVAHLMSMVFPVPGVDSTRLDDSFEDPRDGGARRHNAIDIMAPRGSPVLSVQDGRILKLSRNPKGGITVYATDLDEQFVYYYAHLDHYHAGVYAGKPLLRGDTIGYVGTTGNAPENAPHLHFQVMRMPADKHYWEGDPINPYPLLRRTVTDSVAK